MALTSDAAVMCGRWLTMPSVRSWAAGVIVSTEQPSAAQNACTVPNAAAQVVFVRVRIHRAPMSRSSRP